MKTVLLRLDPAAEEPVYAQIARQIRERIASGDLRAGAELPSVRRIASDLGVNLNTVARAYRLLEEEGFLRIRSRWGATVAEPASGTDADTRKRLRRELRELLARMRQAGLAPAELRRMAEEEAEAVGQGRGEP